MSYDPSRHHRRSIRLPGFDYRSPGAYYVTICTRERGLLFGDVIDHTVRLNPLGLIVADTWLSLSNRYPYVSLDAWIVMPDHLHGIIIISHTSDAMHIKPLGQIIAAFKTISTRSINDLRGMHGVSVWQRNFWEHVVRDSLDLDRVRAYIQNNPRRWVAQS
nr:transposase [Oscillochloris trichoides]